MAKQPEKEWKKLNDFQHARKRNEMYFGSRDPHTQTVLEYRDGVPTAVEATWIPSVFTAVREVLDNALDEVVTHGHGDRVEVSFDPKTMVCVISDNGRGIPINFDKEEQQYAATVLLSETKAGRNFDGDRGASRGMNGIGASVVNFCSEYFILDINRDGKNFQQRFTEGDGTNLVIEDPIIMPSKSKKTGTTVEFKLSKKVFSKLDFPESFVQSRVFEVALCYPSLKVFYNGKRVETKGTVEKTLFANTKPIAFTVRESGFNSQFWLVPGFFQDKSEMAHSLVNAIPAFNGGVHIEAFKRHFFSGLIEALAPMSKRKKLQPNRSDIADGLLVFNITEMDAPSFDSQNKTRLINEECASMVKRALDDPDFFKKVIRNYPEWIEEIFERCAERTQKKDAADINKLAKKSARQKVENLTDANGVDRSKCILLLTEGLSAAAGAINSRNPQVHGVLPLRGKVLNVNGESLKTIMENDALRKVFNSIGLIPGQRANRAALRYGKVYMTCDADQDGANIVSLLVNCFFTLWPELFDPDKEPFLYSFETPLVIATKGKTRKYWYADNYELFKPEDYSGYTITRAKGLAALIPENWADCLANPKLVPIVNDGQLKESLDMLFSDKRADDRKTFMGI